MIEALIGLLAIIIVVGIVYLILQKVISMIPMEENFKQIALLILVLICLLVVLAKGLPLIGVHTGF